MGWGDVDDTGAARAWADGYVVDTPYTEAFIAELCPAWLSMAAVLHGQPPIDTTRPFTWVDLGSGSGASACMVAAANPNVQVWGCDYNPAHVERARGLATKAQLTNCTFDEASFAAVAADDHLGPPEADVVVVHGVYSWISPANQRDIARFIEHRLRPGGIAYLSYEVASGWSAMGPLAEVLQLHTAVDGRRSDVAFADAAAALTELAAGGARYFPIGPYETSQLQAMATANSFYAAHEYLGAHFQPLMFDEVDDVLASARCSYVGSIETTDQMSAYWAPPELVPLLVGTTDVALRQMLRDLIAERPLRRDMFRRGLAIPNRVEQETWLHDLSIVGLGKPFAGAPVLVPGGGVALDPPYYAPLVDALDERPLDVGAILEIHPQWALSDAAGALGLLVGGGYAAPAVIGGPDATTRAATRRLNDVLIAENRRGADHGCLISPVTGSAVVSEYVEMLTTGSLWSGRPADAAALAEEVSLDLTRQERVIREDDVLIEDPIEARAIVERRVSGVLGKFAGVFERLGIC